MTGLEILLLCWAVVATVLFVVAVCDSCREERWKNDARKELLAARKELAALQETHASIRTGWNKLLDERAEAIKATRELLEKLTGPECECCWPPGCDCTPGPAAWSITFESGRQYEEPGK